MSTAHDFVPSPDYPFRFEITSGPTFTKVADAAKYYHDRKVEMPLEFTGILEDTRTGRRSKKVLVADAYGFWAGTDYPQTGIIHIFLQFRGYFIRFGPPVVYNAKKPRESGRPIQLSRIEASTETKQ